MDGNGRWAQHKGLPRLNGHHEGYRTLRKIVLAAGELGIGYLTVYAFSVENWRRPADEVEGLFKLIAAAARDELRVMQENGVRARVAGRVQDVPKDLRDALLDGAEATKAGSSVTLTLAVNYGGRAEIVDAVQSIMAKGTRPEEVTEELISQHMYLPDTPEPDLMIRTAGEMRWSNFLMWEAAYSELWVTEVAWPDFTVDLLCEAIAEYQRRTRKFGGIERRMNEVDAELRADFPK